MRFITIDSIDDERVSAYTNLTEIQLRNRLEPAKGLFIAESPKVIDRAWTPRLADCVSSKQIVAICRRACVHGDLVIVLHQDATDTWDGIEGLVRAMADKCLEDGRPRTVSVVVGPEGGISEDEVEAFTAAGARAVVLGTNILRASAAGPVALSLLARALGRFA